MKKKTLLLVVLSALMLLIFSGCSMYYKMDTKINANGSGTLVLTMGYDDAGLQEMLTSEEYEAFKSEATQITHDGKTYYCVEETTKFTNVKKLEKKLAESGFYVHASGDTFFMENEPADAESLGAEQGVENIDDVKELMYMEINVTFASPICKNIGGVLSNDNKTITWDMDEILKGKDLYATTSAEAKKAASLNVAKNKTYKKAQTIKVKSGAGTVYMDGALVTSGKTKAKNGSHTLLIINQNGTKKSFDFIVDTKAPTIKGAKNNKTYKKNVKLTFSDELSGVKKVTVNGKKISNKAIKNGYTIKKNGKYTVKVTDKAKNVKTVKFTIKK